MSIFIYMALSKNFLTKIYSELVLISLMFLMFFQLISDFIETLYALNLISLSMNENVLALLFLFSPIALAFYKKGKEEFSNKSFVILGELMIFCRIIKDFLNGQFRMLVTGIGVGCFLIFLPVYLQRISKKDNEQGGLKMGLILSFALISTIFLRTLGSSFDITSFALYQSIGWILAIFAALLLYSLLKSPQNIFDDEVKSRDFVSVKIKQSELNSYISSRRLIGLSIGFISIIIIIFFVFSSPVVISRWTEGNYFAIILIICTGITLFTYITTYKPHMISKISMKKLMIWNGLFTLTLTLTILFNQIYFPPFYEEYPIVIYLTFEETIIQQIPLYAMLILFPIILIDFSLISRELIKCKPNIRQLGTSFTLASLFFVLMIFAAIFTTVWDYIPLIGPFFRDMYWVVFLVIGLGISLPISLVKKQTLIFKTLKKSTKFNIKIVGIIAVLAGATITSALILELTPKNPSRSMDSIKIMSYNIQQGYDEDGNKNIEGQLKEIKEEDPDIIGLIESDFCRISSGNSDMVRLIADELNLYSYYGPKTVTGNYGLALLSKYPIKNAKTFYMYSMGEQTATIEAEIEIKGDTYNIYITHLGNYEDPSQRSQIITVLDRLENKENVILMGDVNFETDTNRYNMTVEKLYDCWELAGDDDGGFDMDERIDYIFVSEELSDDVEDCNYLGGKNSDHPAITAELDI